MRDKNKKIGRIKFARDVEGYNGKRSDFPIIDQPYYYDHKDYRELYNKSRKQYHEQIGYDQKQIKPRKTVLNRLKRWWVYLTT